jgi:3-phytase
MNTEHYFNKEHDMTFCDHVSKSLNRLSQTKRLAFLLATTGGVMLSQNILLAQSIPATITVNAKASTSAVKGDADDPAIWVHPTDPAKSVIIGTDKDDNGGLYVWDMNGTEIQYVPLGRPNNVDVRYGMRVGGQLIDITVTNLRSNPKQIKVFKINPADGTLTDITTPNGILTPELADPYGICLYKRPSDGAMFVIESTQVGANKNNLHQYLLQDDGTGKVKGTYVRAIGNGVIQTYVEGLVADDELGYIYASDEPNAIRKFYADPARGDDKQIVAFATDDGISGDREGLAIYNCPGGTGYLIASSQGNSTVKIYHREGEAGDPHKHTLITTIKTNGSTSTDGLDITNLPTSATFPKGFLVKHNSPGKQFVLYAWEDIAQTYLNICPSSKPTEVGEELGSALPEAFSLEQNYPNPFLSGAKSSLAGNPSTMIPFHLEKAASVKLAVLNLMGQTVRTLAAGRMAGGDYAARWDGRNDGGEIVPSGTYLIQLQSGNRTQIKKLMMVK